MSYLKLLKLSRSLSNRKLFAGALEKGGVGALELVAMDMKARLVFL
jgi:hypothetical protein